MPAPSVTRQWVDDLPPDTLFRCGDAPGQKHERFDALRRMASGRLAPLEHVAPDIYYKRVRPRRSHTVEFSKNELARALGWVAGPGVGLAGLWAHNKFGWTTQWPACYMVTSLRATPPANCSIDHIRWHHSTAMHRRSLNWAEVSFVEAVRQFPDDEDFPWNYVLWMIRNEHPLGRMPPDITLRPEAIEAVIDLEQPSAVEVKVRELDLRLRQKPYRTRLSEACTALRERNP